QARIVRVALTIRSSGPLRRVTVLSGRGQLRRLNSSVRHLHGGLIMLKRFQRGEGRVTVIGWIVVVLVVIWQVWKGLTIQEIGFGPLTLKFGRNDPPSE